MTDILIRNVPDEVVAVLDANAQRAGVTRAEYLRRVLAEQRGRALTREQLDRSRLNEELKRNDFNKPLLDPIFPPTATPPPVNPGGRKSTGS